MSSIPAKVQERICSGLKRFQPIIASAKTRDVNESDTVVFITDILQEIFGFDKYSDITSEHMIRGTYCDLVIKIDGKIMAIIEVKAIGLELKDAHVKQAVDYATNQGVDWVILTNGLVWRVYKVIFSKPIDQDLLYEFNICDLKQKDETSIALLWLICKEGMQKSELADFHAQKQALSRYCLAALVTTDPVLEVLRRELKRINPGIRVETDGIKDVLRNEVLKREVQEGDKAESAKKEIARTAGIKLKKTKSPEIPIISLNAETAKAITLEEGESS